MKGSYEYLDLSFIPDYEITNIYQLFILKFTNDGFQYFNEFNFMLK